jgi:hypothetical protein
VIACAERLGVDEIATVDLPTSPCEYFREAFHIAAMRTRRWGDQWDIPTFDLGGPIREDDIKQAAAGGVAREQAEIDQARRAAPGATA